MVGVVGFLLVGAYYFGRVYTRDPHPTGGLMAASRIRVLVADDHPLFRQGLERVLSDYADLRLVGAARDTPEAVAMAQQLRPDIVLMDLSMPGGGGVEATRRIAAAAPGVKVIVLTVSERESDLFAAIEAGARGYLVKDAGTDEVISAIRRVHGGEVIIAPGMAGKILHRLTGPPPQRAAAEAGLTARETEVLKLVAAGLSNREIAARLGRSEHTIKTHLGRILDKLHFRTRAQAAAYAAQAGLLEPPSSEKP